MLTGFIVLLAVFQSTPPVKAATRALSANGYDVGFQSTPPVKAATFLQIYDRLITMISIHAAREGGDLVR